MTDNTEQTTDPFVTALLLHARIRFLATIGRYTPDQFVHLLRERRFPDDAIRTQIDTLEHEGHLHLDTTYDIDGSGRWGRVCWREPDLAARTRNLNEHLARIRAANPTW